jgi:hypothetical protein
MREHPNDTAGNPADSAPPVSIFLCGDVMTGRGIDQILQHHSDPAIHEFFIQSARDSGLPG